MVVIIDATGVVVHALWKTMSGSECPVEVAVGNAGSVEVHGDFETRGM